MQMAGLILGCILLGQLPDNTYGPRGDPTRPDAGRRSRDAGPSWTPGGPAGGPSGNDGGAAARGPSDRRRRSQDMVAAALQLPAGSVLVGNPLGLVAAISPVPDRRQQLETVWAYWRLVQAVADYHYCLDYAQSIEALRGHGMEHAALAAGRTAAAARLREAQLAAVRAQHDLAILARMAIDAPLPLPADRPTVAEYHTYFKELFAHRTPPEPARLAERILPIERTLIAEEADAVEAAEQALDAVGDDYNRGRSDAAAVIACGRELLRQQQAFIRSVCSYNRNIAWYSFSVVGPEKTPQQMVETLIGPTAQPPARPVSGDGGQVRPTSGEEPATPQGPQEMRQGEPHLAPPRPATFEAPDAPPDNEPAAEPTPPRNESTASSAPEPAPRQPADLPETRMVPVETDSAAPPASPPSSPPASGKAKAAKTKSGPSERTARKLWDDGPYGDDAHRGSPPPGLIPSDDHRASRTSTISPLYGPLVAFSPGGRIKQLASAIYWDRSLPKDSGKPINLTECLLRNAGGDRLTTISAYWLLKQRQAQYQVLGQQEEMLEAIKPLVLEHRNDPTGPADGVRWNAAALSAKAATRKAQAVLVEAQYALALRIGALDEPAWPLASTAPHSGNYDLRFEAQPARLRQSWPLRRLAATIPGLVENTRQLADAVVEADEARVATAEHYRTGRAGIDVVLNGILEQTEETSALLDCVTEYNDALAEYALAVQPPGISAARLVESLVMKP